MIAAAAGDYGSARLAPYAQRISERFGPRSAAPSVLDLLPGWMLGALAGQLFGREWFARRIVLDDWFFHARQAPLQASGAREAEPTASQAERTPPHGTGFGPPVLNHATSSCRFDRHAAQLQRTNLAALRGR